MVGKEKGEVKIDPKAFLTDLDGKTIYKEAPQEDGKLTPEPLTLGSACIDALMFGPQKDDTGEEKVQRFFVAFKLKQGDAMSLTVEDKALLKKAVGRFYNALVVGRVYELLDPAAVPWKKEDGETVGEAG